MSGQAAGTVRSSFAERCGAASSARAAAAQALREALRAGRFDRVRVAWCDAHGLLRGKTLVGEAALECVDEGVGIVGTLLLKEPGDRTAWPVFDPAVRDSLPGLAGLAGAANVMLLPNPERLVALPWAPGTAWMPAQLHREDGQPVALDTRRVLQRALQPLADSGLTLRCGLEVEFHVYRLVGDVDDPHAADWPAPAPQVALTHPGYQLLGEDHADQADAVLRLVQSTAQGLGLPLRSLEIELGPSQFEAVFSVMDALAAADAMVLFRHAVKQALRRAGYHATFMCRPPFANVMASGWHLHHSLVDAEGANAFARPAPAPGAGPLDARQVLSDTGAHWLAGLLAHAPAMAALVAPTINAYGRFKPNALAPLAARWGRDNRGAMLRLVGQEGDPATRIENRLGEPAANPYLTMAAHAIAGTAGLRSALPAPQATEAPYAPVATATERLPATLAEALDALQADAAFREGLGDDVLEWYAHLKRFEISRHDAAEDRVEWERRVYFARL